MAARISPATVVVCASAPRRAGVPLPRAAVPVTWVVDVDALLRNADDFRHAGLALALDPAWLASRQALRRALARARREAPGLEAAVLMGTPLAHHAVLVEEGIRVVLVDAFADVGRGSRRPAPVGWPCRNVAWGIWEVRMCPPRRPRGWTWVPGLPAPRHGALHVAGADGVDGARLERLVDWAGRGVARGRAVAITLAELPAILEGRRSAPLAASVLAAA